MNTHRLSFALILFMALTGCTQAAPPKHTLRCMFYNCENYFDTEDDSTTNDNPFTPEGAMRWTSYRYGVKRDRLFRVIAYAGEWEPPSIVGLCEVENRKVIDDLIRRTPLSKYPYRIVHKESPDARGIDAALIYRSDKLKCLSSQFIRVHFSDGRKRTRDIVYATMRTGGGDTLHVFVNHWPSRSGGQRKSDPARAYVASLLRAKVDSIFSGRPLAKILIMGDLNDGPRDKSVSLTLGASPDTAMTKPSRLFNLTALHLEESTGTLKYQGRWSLFDQMIVSGGLLLRPGLRTTADACRIVRADFLLEPDPRYAGVKPKRTYVGPRYNDGFSDHLPVTLDITMDAK